MDLAQKAQNNEFVESGLEKLGFDCSNNYLSGLK